MVQFVKYTNKIIALLVVILSFYSCSDTCINNFSESISNNVSTEIEMSKIVGNSNDFNYPEWWEYPGWYTEEFVEFVKKEYDNILNEKDRYIDNIVLVDITGDEIPELFFGLLSSGAGYVANEYIGYSITDFKELQINSNDSVFELVHSQNKILFDETIYYDDMENQTGSYFYTYYQYYSHQNIYYSVSIIRYDGKQINIEREFKIPSGEFYINGDGQYNPTSRQRFNIDSVENVIQKCVDEYVYLTHFN